MGCIFYAIVYVIYFLRNNRPFPSCLGPLYQNEIKCSAFNMQIIFYSHAIANKTHFHKRGCALGLILKVSVLELGGSLFKWRLCSED